MASLEGALNIIIPVAAVIWFFAIMYGKTKGQMDTFFGWIRSLFSMGKEKIEDSGGFSREIVYE